MATFKLTAIEIFKEQVEIEADSIEEAEQVLMDKLHSGEFIVEIHNSFEVQPNDI